MHRCHNSFGIAKDGKYREKVLQPQLGARTTSITPGESEVVCCARAIAKRAWSVAILAQVPVPQGERSMTPVQVDGLFQSSLPVETVTTFLQCALGLVGGQESCAMVGPVISEFSGCTTGYCSCVAALTISLM